MEFDFYKQYSSLSSVDLLIILQEPSKYQPAAVAAAEKLLSERTVTEEERNTAIVHIQGPKAAVVKPEDESSISELLDIFTGQEVDATLQKRINIGIGILGVYYLLGIYNAISYLIWFSYCSYCGLENQLIIQLTVLAYIPYVLYLLHHRRSRGWKLLFIENVISIAGLIISLMGFIGMEKVSMILLLVNLVPLAGRTALWYLLCREDVSRAFHINADDRKKALRAAVILLVAMGVIALLRSSDMNIVP